jgi:hypothetical protein
LAKSIHELRAIAQGYDIPNLFSMGEKELNQAISAKQADMIPKPKIEIPRPEYDGRLRMRPPSKSSSQHDILALLKPFIDIGLKVSFPHPEQFHMSFDKKEDTGSIKQPLRAILGCAEQVIK